MKTFWIHTLGCKVNQFESEQIASALRSAGMTRAGAEAEADLRIIHTCSVTNEAASKSRSAVRQATAAVSIAPATISLPILVSERSSDSRPPALAQSTKHIRPRVLVTGCWATSHPREAAALPGVDGVLTHADDVAGQLQRLVQSWMHDDGCSSLFDAPSASKFPDKTWTGMNGLPVVAHRQSNQRAMLKIQDGCDAHCTYCIIPKLRKTLWSLPVDQAVAQAKALVAAGHVEIVLTGIFLSAYGQSTALHRRQATGRKPLAELIERLCTEVDGLLRLRLSSLEPGDVTPDLLRTLGSFPQVVPHFHLPLQSGSDAILHRMNRQYTRDDFVRMVDQIRATFDRPALTTDIIVGFPGERDSDFDQTLAMADDAAFIHTHAFGFSPRPGTAAARWKDGAVDRSLVRHRIAKLRERAAAHSLAFRQQFLGKTVEILIEDDADPAPAFRHGRTERYFDVRVPAANLKPGDRVTARIQTVDTHTLGAVLA